MSNSVAGCYRNQISSFIMIGKWRLMLSALSKWSATRLNPPNFNYSLVSKSTWLYTSELVQVKRPTWPPRPTNQKMLKSRKLKNCWPKSCQEDRYANGVSTSLRVFKLPFLSRQLGFNPYRAVKGVPNTPIYFTSGHILTKSQITHFLTRILMRSYDYKTHYDLGYYFSTSV